MTALTAKGRNRLGVWLLVAAVVIVLVVLSRPARNDGPPLDPTSTGPLGTKALVLLLERLGSGVSVGGGLPPADGVVLLLVDTLEPSERDELRAWIDSGGTLVTTDPRSPLVKTGLAVPPGQTGDTDGIPTEVVDRRCESPVFAGAARIRPGGSARFESSGGVACYRDDDGAVVVVENRGAGSVVAVASPLVWVNELLNDDDNSVLAASLLSPSPGTRTVLFRAPAPGGGDDSLVDLLPDRVVTALWQLVAAFALVVLWRARRLGRPVLEPQPVELAGSELVVAVGDLLQRSQQRDAAGAMVRAAGRREMAERLGVAPDTPVDVVAQVVADRTGLDSRKVSGALRDGPVPSDRALIELARELDSIREEVAHAR